MYVHTDMLPMPTHTGILAPTFIYAMHIDMLIPTHLYIIAPKYVQREAEELIMLQLTMNNCQIST